MIEDWLGLICNALMKSRQGRFEDANRALAAALVSAPDIQEEFRPIVRAALAYATLHLKHRQTPSAITPQVWSQARALLDDCESVSAPDLFAMVMFELLTDLGEQRRAIPFGERALAMASDAREYLSVADWLSKIGRCYSRIGLRDHAAIAYRASMRIFRNETADPRLPAVLLGLANAIRKSTPEEAEELYKEAALWWEKKGQLESATAAWMNLAILCSDQQRFTEAIDYYDRVRRVRESSAHTPPVRIGVLYNNLANCYRKMSRFGEAHQAIELSIDILRRPGVSGPADASSLALAYGTKGLILRDEGHDFESIEWFRCASAELEKQQSPNLETLIEELEYEATALRRLSQTGEAHAIEEKVKALRQKAAEIPGLRHDPDAPVEISDGALLVEVNAGMRSGTSDTEISALGSSLDEILQDANLGRWHGLVRIPESSTLIYYGPNGEAMYQAIEITLREDSRCQGALVTIRQGTDHRQILVPCALVH